MTANEVLARAYHLLGTGVYSSLQDAMLEVAYRVFTRYDFEQWHKGLLTRQTGPFVTACRRELGGFDRLELWGMKDPQGGEEAPSIYIY